ALFFAIAALTRSLLYTYAGVAVFLVAYFTASLFLGDLENRNLTAILDPYGVGAFDLVTRYWTISEKNTGLMQLRGILLANRLVWLGVAAAIMLFTWARFKFTAGGGARRSRRKILAADAPTVAVSTGALPRVAQSFGRSTTRMQFLSQARIETIGALRGIPFQIIMFAGLLNMFGGTYSLDDLYGTKIYPVTNLMLRAVEGSFVPFVLLMLIFYSGELVWRERSLRMSELFDALPVRTW